MLYILEIGQQTMAWAANDEIDFIDKCSEAHRDYDYDRFGPEPFTSDHDAFQFWQEIAASDIQTLHVFSESEARQYIKNREQGWIVLSEAPYLS